MRRNTNLTWRREKDGDCSRAGAWRGKDGDGDGDAAGPGAWRGKNGDGIVPRLELGERKIVTELGMHWS